jgi:hypothetical protein
VSWESTTIEVAGLPPMSTNVLPGRKFDPVIVIAVPPAAVPVLGEIAVTVGVEVTPV